MSREKLADRFGTKGAPISLTTACASGATAIQLGVEAIRRGETEAALCVGTDCSVTAEEVIRFSLLSALSTANDDPEEAAKPFSKNRDGFVIAEGAAALVLEDYDAAVARGAEILAVIRGAAEKTDDFHRTRSKPDGSAIIGALRQTFDDAGMHPDEIDYINAHGTGTPENDKMEAMSLEAVFGERHPRRADQLEQVDDRPHAHLRRARIEAVFSVQDDADRHHPADDQLQGARSDHQSRRRAQRRARAEGRRRCCPTPSASAARTPA